MNIFHFYFKTRLFVHKIYDFQQVSQLIIVFWLQIFRKRSYGLLNIIFEKSIFDDQNDIINRNFEKKIFIFFFNFTIDNVIFKFFNKKKVILSKKVTFSIDNDLQYFSPKNHFLYWKNGFQKILEVKKKFSQQHESVVKLTPLSCC